MYLPAGVDAEETVRMGGATLDLEGASLEGT